MKSCRAILDTNVVVASQRATSPTSPNVEILVRWKAGAFVWLITKDIVDEYSRKLLDAKVDAASIAELFRDLIFMAEVVPIEYFHLRHYPDDPDDTAFILAALNGSASHLVSYDDHLHTVSVFYPEFITCEPVEFLRYLRG